MIVRDSRFAFVSYAKEDRQHAEAFVNKMEEYSIRSWVAFRDIAPGEIWDIAIERAIRQAYFVCVIASIRSISSSYVRAEVENAIQAGKSVIPIRIDKTELPLRWGMFQSIEWSVAVTEDEYRSMPRSEQLLVDTIDRVINKISSVIPQCTMRELVEYLGDDTRINEVKSLLTTYYEWIPCSEIRYARSSYGRQDSRWGKIEVNKTVDGENIDIILGREDSDGWRCTIAYLGSPYNPAIGNDGNPSTELQEILHKARKHMKSFPIGDYYDVSIVVGRRKHWTSGANAARKVLQKQWEGEFSHYYGCHLLIMSYDRLLENS